MFCVWFEKPKSNNPQRVSDEPVRRMGDIVSIDKGVLTVLCLDGLYRTVDCKSTEVRDLEDPRRVWDA